MPPHTVRISGIRVRNLDNVSVEFKTREIVLFTGLSGSGKTSLAFDTINALGLHRYVSTLPSFFAQTFADLPKPSVEACVGLSPTIAVQQNYFSHNSRTTVGATTQISHYLSLLFALDGEILEPETRQTLKLTSKEYIIAYLLSLSDQTKLTFLAPILHKSAEDIQKYIREGFTKIRVDGSVLPIYSFMTSGVPQQSKAYIIIDTLVKNDANQARLKVSLLSALELGSGHCAIIINDQEQTFSTYSYDPVTQQKFTPLTFQDFFPYGFQTRCYTCQGSGLLLTIASDSIIHPHRSILDDCCTFAKSSQSTFYKEFFQSFARHLQFDVHTPWEHLSKEIQEAFLYGKEHLLLPICVFDPSIGRKTTSYKIWKGVLNEIGEKIRYAAHPQKYLPQGITAQTCPICKGTGLKALAISATWNNKHYDEFQNMSLSHIYDILNNMTPSPIVQDVIQALLFRLSVLIDLGLSYLTPSRPLATLSGGEQERTALAKHIGSNLKGITYVLDEPSIGLHPKDIQKLTQVILKLRDQGNTVLLVEHEDSMFSIADRVIDIGPEAGVFGGKIQFNGSPEKFLKESDSLTAKYLRKEISLSLPPKNPQPISFLSLHNANIHNLKNISISIPLERITAVTGVSGSGKSSLINEWLVPQVEQYLDLKHSPYLHITNGHLAHLVHVSRELPYKTLRSIPLTYIKAFDALRQLFAELPQSKQLGFSKSHFSFNLPLGACIECKGLGIVSKEALIHMTCPACQGLRFQKQILEVQYKGKTISDILDMTAQEGANFFQDQKKLYEPIQALCTLGLHYLPLGRPLFSLSGGEIQRLKLAYEFLHPRKNPTLYVLDEPSIGLHTHDLQPLINIFSLLIQHKHTVVIIEHNMHLVQVADYIIELGPEGGELGGQLLACCPIDHFVQKQTHTAQALRPYVENTIPLPSIKNLPIPKPPYAIEIYDAHHGILKHIDLSFPNYALSVITGPSASGKHTLLFDVLYAYGNITYTEILPPYLRQILIKKTPTPKVKAIQGLAPVVAIRNLSKSTQSRLHVAHALDIAGQLESLFAAYGQPYAPTGEALIKSTPENIAHYLITYHSQVYATITIPIPPYEDIDEFIQEKQRKGFLKLFANDTFYDLEDSLPSNLNNPALVIQHIHITENNRKRLLSALSLSFSLSQQVQILIHNNSIQTYLFSNGWFDSKGNSYPNITKKNFSPYYTEGRCPTCQGSGERSCISLQQHRSFLLDYTPQQIFQALCPLTPLSPLQALLDQLQLSSTITFASISQETWLTLCTELESLLTQYVQLPISSIDLQRLLVIQECSDCSGTGVHPQTNNIRIQGLSIIELYRKDISFVQTFLTTWASGSLPDIQDILIKLSFLNKVGLNYIGLGQKQYTLSCGEIYRLHIVKMVSSQLTDVVYLLEDPLSGLHPHDQTILIHLLQDLVSQGNTIIASDRTQNLIPHADHTIYLGPGSGPKGGHIITKHESTLKTVDINRSERLNAVHQLHIHFSAHYCKNVKTVIPLRSLTTIIGVSGAGKTTLLKEGIYRQASHIIQTSDAFSNIILVDSSPLTSSTRSDIGSYFDITPSLREFYASLSQAKALNISPSMFSPNTKQGQCPDCLGLGYRTIDRVFYAQETIPCSSCSGFRIQSLSQEVTYQNKHFGHILQTSIQDILGMFPFLKKIHAPIQALMDMGLEYLQLGQPFSSLSTSEKASIKILKQLSLPLKQPSLFLLDEITTSLDQKKKKAVYALYLKLIHEGHSIVQIDNDLQFIRYADYLIELGPGAGKYGGKIVFAGAPSQYDPTISPKT